MNGSKHKITLVALEGTGATYKVDTIEYEGKNWLVPEWLENPSQGWYMPARIVCLETLQYQVSETEGIDFVLNTIVPKSVFEGRVPNGTTDQFVVVEKPDIRFEILGGFH